MRPNESSRASHEPGSRMAAKPFLEVVVKGHLRIRGLVRRDEQVAEERSLSSQGSAIEQRKG